MHVTSAAPEGAPTLAQGRRRRPLAVFVRLGVALLGGVLALASVFLYQGYARQRAELRQLINAVGLASRQPEAASRILWEPDVDMGRLQVARALLYEALDRGAFAALPPGERMTAMALVPERLELAREIAADTLRRRPAAWSAAMILGATRYVEWSLRGDPRLLTQRWAWERPLEVAAEIAPGEDEPQRFLALAYVELWPALTGEERRRVLPLLRRALADRPTFERAAATWLAVATPSEVQAVIPDASWAWQVLSARAAHQRQWQDYRQWRERLFAAQARELAQDLENLERRRAGGDVRGARTVALNLLAATSPDRRHVPLVERVLALIPPGPLGEGRAPAVHAWLHWALEMALWEQPGLNPVALRRLASLLDPLPPPQAALAALVAGDLVAAEAIERRHEAINTEAWAPYCIVKARVLAVRGEGEAARRLLGWVQMLWVGSLPELRSRLAVAVATGDAAGRLAAEEALAKLAAEDWPATVWRWRGGVATAGFLAARSATGLALAFTVAPPQGAALLVSLDGQAIPVGPATFSQEVIVAAPVEAGVHVLVVSSAGGGRVVPGPFRLLGEE